MKIVHPSTVVSSTAWAMEWNTSEKMKEREILNSHFPEQVRKTIVLWENYLPSSWQIQKEKSIKIESQKDKTKLNTIIVLEIDSQDLVDH